jgi:hypothetical protein
VKISVRKVGGPLGGQRPYAELDTATLSPEERTEILSLLEATGFWQLPSQLPGASGIRDGLGTIIEVADEARHHSVDFELPTAPETLRDLVGKVRSLSKK